MGGIAIYTCVCGGYDVVQAPLAVWPDADYICFSDVPVSASVWQYRPVEKVCPDDAMTSRWYKMNPHLVLPEYEYSLWIDGNISIISPEFYPRLSELMSEGCLYAGVQHPSRDDFFDEAEAILKGRRESLRRLVRTLRFLESEGFPRHSGLLENNIILRAHNDPKIVAVDSLWWEMLQHYSRRDQMSLMYCLWKNEVTPSLLLPPGFCVRNHPAFRYIVHDKPYLKDRSLRGLCSRRGLSALWADALCAFRKAAFHLLFRWPRSRSRAADD